MALDTGWASTGAARQVWAEALRYDAGVVLDPGQGPEAELLTELWIPVEA